VAVLVPAGAAGARTYDVHTCSLPGGAGRAPVGDSEAGWRPSLRPNTQFAFLTDDCPGGGVLRARLSGNERALGSGADWRFVPPPQTSIAGFAIDWEGDAASGGEVSMSRSDQPDPVYVRRYAGPFARELVVVNGIDIASLAIIVACSFSSPTCPSGPDHADARVHRGTFSLHDLNGPRAASVGGELTTAPVLRGTLPVRFDGEDAGGGLYRVVVAADGVDRAFATLPDDSGRCRDARPGAGGAYEFAWPRPCPLRAQAAVAVDTRALPEGRHAITGFLEDAAGNRTTLFGPVDRDVDNERGAVNGANGGDGAVLARRGRRRVATSFSRRRVLLRGRLTRGGQPVAAAVLDILALNRVPGARLRRIGEARTDARGNYRVRTRSGPSRLLRVAYRAYVDDATPAAQVDVTHRVRAGVQLSVLRRLVPAGGRARFAGRVRGGFIPKRGKLVELQAFDAGAWRTFRTLRTDRGGRFRSSYRFRRAGPGRRFSFRARVRYERGFPFILGTSRSVGLRVG
jgi:hypothetical protein